MRPLNPVRPLAPVAARAAAFFLLWGLCAVHLGPPAVAAGRLLEQRESLYNNIFVRESGDLIVMLFGKNRRYWQESAYDPRDPRALPVAYTRFMTVALAYPARVSSLLEIGVGGGRTVAYLNLHMPELAITAVELDREVVALAKRYFGLKESPSLQVVVKDGRIFLNRTRERYDVIMVDSYRGPFVPFHLMTREFFETAKARLAPGGVLVQNIEPTTMLFEAALATLRSVFDRVDLYAAGGNVVAVAYDGEARSGASLRARAGALQRAHGFKYPLAALLRARRVLTTVPDGAPLVDDFAPVELLRATERHNRGLEHLSKVPAD